MTDGINIKYRGHIYSPDTSLEQFGEMAKQAVSIFDLNKDGIINSNNGEWELFTIQAEIEAQQIQTIEDIKNSNPEVIKYYQKEIDKLERKLDKNGETFNEIATTNEVYWKQLQELEEKYNWELGWIALEPNQTPPKGVKLYNIEGQGVGVFDKETGYYTGEICKQGYIEFPENISEEDKKIYTNLFKKYMKNTQKLRNIDKNVESIYSEYDKLHKLMKCAEAGYFDHVLANDEENQFVEIYNQNNPYLKQIQDITAKRNKLWLKGSRTEQDNIQLEIYYTQIMQLEEASKKWSITKNWKLSTENDKTVEPTTNEKTNNNNSTENSSNVYNIVNQNIYNLLNRYVNNELNGKSFNINNDISFLITHKHWNHIKDLTLKWENNQRIPFAFTDNTGPSENKIKTDTNINKKECSATYSAMYSEKSLTGNIDFTGSSRIISGEQIIADNNLTITSNLNYEWKKLKIKTASTLSLGFWTPEYNTSSQTFRISNASQSFSVNYDKYFHANIAGNYYNDASTVNESFNATAGFLSKEGFGIDADLIISQTQQKQNNNENISSDNNQGPYYEYGIKTKKTFKHGQADVYYRNLGGEDVIGSDLNLNYSKKLNKDFSCNFQPSALLKYNFKNGTYTVGSGFITGFGYMNDNSKLSCDIELSERNSVILKNNDATVVNDFSVNGSIKYDNMLIFGLGYNNNYTPNELSQTITSSVRYSTPRGIQVGAEYSYTDGNTNNHTASVTLGIPLDATPAQKNKSETDTSLDEFLHADKNYQESIAKFNREKKH